MSLPLLIQRCFLPAFFVLLLPHLAFAQADAGDNQLVCGQSANLTGSVAQDTSVKWTVLFGDGVLENPVDPQSVINNLSFGKNVLLYEYIFDEISYSTDTLIIYRYNVIDNQTINYFVCGDNLPEASNGGPFDSLAIWMYPPGIQPVTDSTFSASSLNPGLNIFNIKILYPDCDSSIITIHINSDTILTAQAGDDQT
ncbi:MAG: hypothetical protein K1X77_03060, partial [Bacteroidia bacterium]|nr:hypothetical protein [Bacteroidia bacterium]